jgi:5-methylthioadenosine/S-adenosylhomocysteine deaminase
MIIRNATILDFQDLSRRPGVDVHIQGNRVKRITPAGRRAGRPPEAATGTGEGEIDAAGLYLIPGLVNAHSHTAMTLLRGSAEDCTLQDWFNRYIWRYERNLTAEDVYWGTLLGAAEMLLAGVTCVADHYFHMERAWEAYLQSGMRADLAWAAFGTGEGWESQWAEALTFSREYARRDPRLTVSLGPHSPYICPEGFLRQAAEAASELGLKLHIHVAEESSQLERSLAEKGCTPVEVLERNGILGPGTVLAHAYWVTDGDLSLIRERGAGVVHCPKTYMKFGDVNDFLPRAFAAGVSVGLGTDGPGSGNRQGIFEAARVAALLAKAARRDARVARIGEVLPLCHKGGELLGFGGYGRIEEGSLADLVLLDPCTPAMMPEHDAFANILYSLGERNVHTVLVDGQVLVRAGRLVRLDLEELARKSGEIASRLIRSAGGRPMREY